MSFLQQTQAFLNQHYVYEWMPIYTAMILVLPAITHYLQHEYYSAVFLVIFSTLRAGYHVDAVLKVVPMNAYHMTYVLSNAAVHFNILATGMSYRRDLTGIFMLILAVYESLVMLWRLPKLYDRDGVYKDSAWNIYMGLVLLWNLTMHDMGTGAVFIKGLFWGAYLWRFYTTKRCYPFGSLSDFRNQVMEVASFMQFAHINPSTQKAFPKASSKQASPSLPPDDLD